MEKNVYQSTPIFDIIVIKYNNNNNNNNNLIWQLDEYLQSINTATLTSRTYANTMLNTRVYSDNFVFSVYCEKKSVSYVKQNNLIQYWGMIINLR